MAGRIYSDISGYKISGEYYCSEAERRAGPSLDDCAEECDQEPRCRGVVIFKNSQKV